jgi:hypothetical protein
VHSLTRHRYLYNSHGIWTSSAATRLLENKLQAGCKWWRVRGGGGVGLITHQGHCQSRAVQQSSQQRSCSQPEGKGNGKRMGDRTTTTSVQKTAYKQCRGGLYWTCRRERGAVTRKRWHCGLQRGDYRMIGLRTDPTVNTPASLSLLTLEC